MSDYLPDAVVVEILLHVPPTTLLRWMSVCKAWNKIIKSHTFISSHLQRSLSKPTTPLILITKIPYYPNPSVVLNEQFILYSNAMLFPLHKIANLERLFLFPPRFARLVGSLHGIVCLEEKTMGSIILWNPLIQRRVILRPTWVRWTSLGFGFDSKKNDYKVIKISFFPEKVELYSLNENAWRVIDISCTGLGVSNLSYRSCFFNGNVHFIGLFNCYRPINVFVFNVEEEKFTKMELPAELVNEARNNRLHFIVIEGCLSIVQYYGSLLSETNRNDGCIIWKMREYGVAESWSKICIVNIEGGIDSVFGLSKSAKVLLVKPIVKGKQEFRSMYSFDTKSQEMTDLEIQDDILSAFDCTESLLLLDKESCIKQDDKFGEWQDSDWWEEIGGKCKFQIGSLHVIGMMYGVAV